VHLRIYTFAHVVIYRCARLWIGNFLILWIYDSLEQLSRLRDSVGPQS